MKKGPVLRNSIVVFLFLVSGLVISQPFPIVVPNYTACPNQIVTVTAQWNNVLLNQYTLTPPPPGLAIPLPPGAQSFTISGTASGQYQLCGTGTSGNGPESECTFFGLTIAQPPALGINNQGTYCSGTTATITADVGGSQYYIAGGSFGSTPGTAFTPAGNNIFTIPNLSQAFNGSYTITSAGGCTLTGITSLSVSPSTPLSINSSSNACQDSCVILNGNLANNPNFQNFQWEHANGVITFPNSSPSHTLCNLLPNHAGVYKVTADLSYNGISCPRTASTSINVVATSPVFATASPKNILCQGDKLSLSASTNVPPVSYSWTGPGGFNSPLQSPTITPLTALNTGNYSVTALYTNGFISCRTKNSVSVTVVQVVKPVITMPSNVCQDHTVNLSVTAGTSAIGYTWFGPSFTSQAQSALINNIQPNQSGVYYVTAKFQVGTTTCSATDSKQLNVVPVNTISVIPPQQVCEPNNAYLQANANGANSYAWVGPGGYTSPGANPIVYYPKPSASGIYTVTAFFGGGNITCSTTNTVELEVFPVMHFSLTPVRAGIPLYGMPICYNDEVTVEGPSGATSYTWTSSTGYKSNTKDMKLISAQPQNSGTYTLHINLGPCVTSASTEIRVLDAIQFSLTPHNRVICEGDTTVFEVGAKGGSEGTYDYEWNPAVYLPSPTGSVQVAVPLGSIIYNVKAKDLGCPNYFIVHSFEVTVNKPPKPQLFLDRTYGCEPLCLFYDSQTGEDAGITTYDFGGLRQVQRDSFMYCLEKPGTYSLTIHSKGKNGCSGKYKFPYPIVVYPKSGSEILVSPENPTTTDEITFIPSEKNGPVINYSWMFMGGEPTVIDTAIKNNDTSNVKNPIRQYENVGNYPVRLISTTENGCIDTTFRVLVIRDDFRVYIPNSFTPNGDGVNDEFGIKGIGMKTEGFFMEIFNRRGALVFSTKNIEATWDGRVNGEKAIDGTYIYRIRVVGMNGEGKKDFVGHVNVLK